MDWRNTDGQFILACCVIPHLFHIVPGGIYKRQAGTSFNPYVYGYLNEICDHTFHKESGWAHAGSSRSTLPHMPEKYRNSVIFGSIHGCSIKQNILKPNGSTYTASRGDDFLVSGDKNFRPINLKWGPNGDIYLIDWHDQNPCHQTNPDDWDYDRGRVYRIQLKGTKPKKAEDLGKKTPAELLKLIDDADPYRYRTALRLLSGLSKEDRMAVGQPLVEKGNKMELRELWAAHHLTKSLTVGGDGAGSNPGPTTDPRLDWLVRSIHHADEVTDDAISVMVEGAKKAGSATLRRELASAALRLSDKHDVTPLLRALMARKEDAKDPVIPQLVWLAYEKVIARLAAQREPKNAVDSPLDQELYGLVLNADNEFVRDQIVPKVMRRLVATGKPERPQLVRQVRREGRRTRAREKALEGLALALDKQSVNAPEGWDALQKEIAKENNAKHVALANKLAVVFRDPAALKRAIETAKSVKLPTDARAEGGPATRFH